MFSIAPDLQSASLASAGRLEGLARTAARAGIDPSGPGAERAMAAVASEAMFNEALLGAIHSRLGEIRTVTK